MSQTAATSQFPIWGRAMIRPRPAAMARSMCSAPSVLVSTRAATASKSIVGSRNVSNQYRPYERMADLTSTSSSDSEALGAHDAP